MKNRIHSHNFIINDETIAKNQKKTAIVVMITGIMMVGELLAGYFTGSMALLADGWHMASHAGALFISLLAYHFAKSPKFNEKFTFGGGKFIPLGGYTSAIALTIAAFLMAIESVERLITPQDILFKQAIIVAVLGLAVNVICAVILMDKSGAHHHSTDRKERHEHTHDHNIRSAYIHVIADAFTSVLAIIALTLGLLFNKAWLDPVMGIVGSLVIMKWAYNLCRDTAWELLDGNVKSADKAEVRNLLEKDGASVNDLHIWRIAPKALACEVSITGAGAKQIEHKKMLLENEFGIKHANIEIQAAN